MNRGFYPICSVNMDDTGDLARKSFTSDRFFCILQSKIERGISLEEAYKNVMSAIVNKYKYNHDWMTRHIDHLNSAHRLIQCELNQ
jgi:hypothetical protein